MNYSLSRDFVLKLRRLSRQVMGASSLQAPHQGACAQFCSALQRSKIEHQPLSHPPDVFEGARARVVPFLEHIECVIFMLADKMVYRISVPNFFSFCIFLFCSFKPFLSMDVSLWTFLLRKRQLMVGVV
jgi:hypothetical protein